MLKISKPLSVEKVSEYYRIEYGSADQAYYAEGKQLVGEWHGRLADEFGLVGAVAEEHYSRLAAGKHPWTGEQLIKHRPPAENGPAWLRDEERWKAHVSDLFRHAMQQGYDCFRTVDTAKEISKQPRLQPSEILEVPVPSPVSDRAATLLEMHRIAAAIFQENLRGELGASARKYLESRKISDQSVTEFGLGVSSGNGRQLVENLRRFGPEWMETSGLFIRDRNGEILDRFRNRLMFPIHNAHGEVVAFGARELRKGIGPKYLNSPSTEIYRKSEVLYNLRRASPEAQKGGRLVLVEGYLDAIAAHQAGVKNVAAICGTALAKAQIAEVKRCASQVVLNLDPDEAGRTATLRHSRALMDEGLAVRSVQLSGDPAEYIERSGGEQYRKKIAAVRPFIESLAGDARQRFNLQDTYGRVDAIHSIIDTLGHVRPEHRGEMAKEVAAYLRVTSKQQLKKQAEERTKKPLEHIAAWDWTLAPHKSYSVTALVGGDRGLIEDHKKAVRIALDAGERYTQARMGNINTPITTANWVAALFLHDTARPVGDEPPNPHLHTHAVAFNMTNAGDKIRSVQAHEWYRVQSFVAAVYQAEMAYAARTRGYELEHGRNYSTAIKGYTEEYLKAASARTEEIERKKAEKGLIGAEADERINKRLRQAKQAWEPETLWEAHRAQAERYGNSPARVVEAARERLSLVLAERQPELRADRAIEFAKQRLLEGNAVMDHYEIMRDALRYGLGHIRLKDVERAFELRLAQSEGEFIQVGHHRTHAPGRRFTTREMRELERESINLAAAQQGKTEAIAATLTRDEFRESYKRRTVEARVIELKDAQMWMAWRVLTSPDQVMIVRGHAGVGKTWAMQAIADVARQRDYEVAGLAPTGASANKLAEVGIRSETLQMHLLNPVSAAKRRLYILDEGSLVGTRQFHAFLKGVGQQHRVIIAYDRRQHQSVEAGRIIEELEQAGVRSYRLEKIIRQERKPELLEAVNLLAKGYTREGLRKFDEQGRIKEVADRAKRIGYLAGHFAIDPDHTTAVAPDNRTIEEINLATRRELQKQAKLGPDRYEAIVLTSRRDVRHADRMHAMTYNVGDIVRFGKGVKSIGVTTGQYGRVVSTDAERNLLSVDVGRGRFVTYTPAQIYGVELYTAERRTFAEGERVQITRPWRIGANRKIANREIGTLEKLQQNGKGTLRLESGKALTIDLAQMPHLDYGYAGTSYSLQSRTAEKILVHLDMGDSTIRPLLDKSLVYVSASRGSREILFFTDDKQILLSEHSPVLRLNEKPKALAREEIEGHAFREAVRLGC